MSIPILNKWHEWHPISEWDDLPSLSGVYEIYNQSTGLSYIGSAVQLRKRGHYSALSAGKSHNPGLQKDFSEMGEACFSFRILNFCPNENPVPLEQERIDERDFNTLYNLTPIAGSTLGYRFTDEQVQEASKRRRGVPVPFKTRKRNWQRSVEFDFKSKRYKKLLREFLKTSEYTVLCKEIECYLATEPYWGKPVVAMSVPDGKKMVLGKGFQTWWMCGGGHEHADARYSVSAYDWKFMTEADAGLKTMALGDSRMKTVRLIAERVINERLSPQIDRDFIEAVKSGTVSLEYKPIEHDAAMFISRSIGKYEDGSVEYASQSNGKVSLEQEWYRNGNPRLSLKEDHIAKTIQKKVWHKTGNRQCLLHYADGLPHGVVCRWSSDELLIYAARYEHGKELTHLRPEEVPALPAFTELLPRPSEE